MAGLYGHENGNVDRHRCHKYRNYRLSGIRLSQRFRDKDLDTHFDHDNLRGAIKRITHYVGLHRRKDSTSRVGVLSHHDTRWDDHDGIGIGRIGGPPYETNHCSTKRTG